MIVVVNQHVRLRCDSHQFTIQLLGKNGTSWSNAGYFGRLDQCLDRLLSMPEVIRDEVETISELRDHLDSLHADITRAISGQISETGQLRRRMGTGSVYRG
jgi:hypothetical protein